MPYTNAQARDLNNLFHPYTNLKLLEETGPLIIERGQGVRVYDTAGRDYIEALSGLWCTSLGWGDNELAETAADAAGQPKKKKIISRKLAYHGVTVAAASLTGLPANHTSFDAPLSFALH